VSHRRRGVLNQGADGLLWFTVQSDVNLFNFFEVQNIHPESKRNFHTKISLKTNFNLCGTGVCSATISLVLLTYSMEQSPS
jgi:hypothetical protein